MMTAEEDQLEEQHGGEEKSLMMMQLQEAENDHAAKVHHAYDWSTLPRSIRWRLQLGILSEPPPPPQPTQQQQLDLEMLLKHNQATEKAINDKFKELVTNHVEVEEEDNGGGENGGDDGTKETSSAANTGGDADEIDPLTAMVMEEQERETRKAELYLKYRKERARRKRGLTTEARIIESECDEVVDRASVSW